MKNGCKIWAVEKYVVEKFLSYLIENNYKTWKQKGMKYLSTSTHSEKLKTENKVLSTAKIIVRVNSNFLNSSLIKVLTI